MQTGTWFDNCWLYDKMQAHVARTFGIVPEPSVHIIPEPSVHIKQMRARQSQLKLRSRTLPYLGGITGRMRQR
jgi:hypothetical protein